MEKENNGFTLLEVLVAVIILALVAVPLLRSFVSAYHVNARSRETMRATTLAQNEMEIFEREKLEVLLEYANAGEGGGEEADPADPTDPQDQRRQEWYGDYTVVSDPPYTTTFKDETTNEEWVQEHTGYLFKKTGVINDESGRDNFDVYVTLDPAAKESTDLYYNENTTPLLFMNTLSGADSASYVQRVNQVNEDGTVVKRGEDEEAYEQFVQAQIVEEGSNRGFNEMQFASLLNRTITLTIEQIDNGDQTVTVAKVNYTYELADPSDTETYESANDGFGSNTKRDWYEAIPEQSRIYTPGDKVIFNNAQNLDEDGKPVELKNVYLFYAPMVYDWGGDPVGGPYVRNDRIVVQNADNLPVNIYLIRQNLCTTSGDKVGVYTRDENGVEMEPPIITLPLTYKVNIDVTEGIIGDDETAATITALTGQVKKKGQTYGSYFTNLNLGTSSGTAPGTTELRLKDAASGAEENNKETVMENMGLQTLDATQAKDRIYTMTVRVYRSGSDADGNGQPDADMEPLVELTGTKVE